MARDFFGRVRVRSRFFLGPMAEFTNPAMRKVSIDCGAGMVCTEMADAARVLAGESMTRKLVTLLPSEHPIAAQIIASDPDTAADAARALVERGFDVVDLNAGCAIRRIMSKGMGADLLRDLDRLARIVHAMSAAVDVPVTVKIRSGFEEGNINAVEVARVCEDAGAAGIGIHARTAQAGYKGPADWSVIAAVKQAVGIAVFGSGEVRTAADALRMMSQTRCDAVLVARGALGNPWIFRDAKHLLAGGSAAQLRRPTPADVLRVMKEHYRLLVTHAGRRKANLLFRRVGGYYCSHIPDSDQLKQSLQQSRQDDDIAAVLAGRP